VNIKNNKKDGRVSRFFNESLIQISLKTPKININIKIQTVLYVIIEVALVIAILRYV